MVIQRWQTVLLFISIVLLSIFSVSDFGVFNLADGARLPIEAMENTGYWIFNIVIIILILVSIFLYRNSSLQKTLIAIALLMIIASAIWGYNYLHTVKIGSATMSLGYSWILLIVSFALLIGAIILISSDEKKLRAADRLR